MTFLQPIALLGLLFALTPVIIHLLNLLRHRTVPWAAPASSSKPERVLRAYRN